MLRKVQLTYSSHIARTILMFLKQKPLYGDRYILATLLIALVMTGCSSMAPDGAADRTAQAGVTAPRSADAAPAETPQNVSVAPQFVGFRGASTTPPGQVLVELDLYDSLDYFDFEQDRNVPLSLEIEIQAALAEQAGADEDGAIGGGGRHAGGGRDGIGS